MTGVSAWADRNGRAIAVWFREWFHMWVLAAVTLGMVWWLAIATACSTPADESGQDAQVTDMDADLGADVRTALIHRRTRLHYNPAIDWCWAVYDARAFDAAGITDVPRRVCVKAGLTR